MLFNSSSNLTEKNERHDQLKGKRAWIVTTGRAGENSQCLGVAEALGLEIEFKTISPPAPWRYLAPWGPTPPGAGIGSSSGQFSTPLPEIILGTGRQAVPYIRALRKLASKKTLPVFLQNPGAGNKVADLIWISDHDRGHLSGENVISTLTAPHRITADCLRQALKTAKLDTAGLTRPCIAVSVGGNNSVYKFNSATCQRFAQHLAKLAQSGLSFLVTPSRRTDKEIINVIHSAISSAPHRIWDGAGHNPYFEYLAYCDAVIVTADSVNMTGEAIATQKPVYIFEPDGGSRKFKHFHDQLQQRGITRPFDGTIETWRYEPLDATQEIAREIEMRWHQKQSETT